MKYPVARIHVWGGFGSQLYGVYTYLLLRSQHPTRESRLLLHSSGVTARSPEINLLNRNLPIEFINDFSVAGPVNGTQLLKATTIKLSKFLKIISSLLGFVDSLETELGDTKTRYRTIQFRGHYTYLALDPYLLKELISLPDDSGSPLFVLSEPLSKSQIGVHFRLGDLLNLKSKTYLNPERISKLLQSELNQSRQDVVVFTDSLEEFWNNVRGEILVQNIYAFSVDPITTVQELIKSDIFIGTTSKISIWVCIFRCFTTIGGVSYMPVEMKRTLDNQLRYLNSSGVRYYA